MTVRELLKTGRADILRIAREHGASNVRVFGSAVRHEDSSASDLDLLVDMDPDRSLLDHCALIQDLQEVLGVKVDVVTERALHWYVRDRILKEAKPL